MNELHPLLTIGSRWMINYGIATMTVEIIAIHESKIAWMARKSRLSGIDTALYFLNGRMAVILPPKPVKTSFWQRLFGKEESK